MIPSRRHHAGPSSLDLVEDAVQLVRLAPVDVLLSYYMGAVPFVVGALFFQADMASSSEARRHISAASLALGLLFLWMKYWQAEFACRIRCQASYRPTPKFSPARTGRILLYQACVHPLALFVAPLLLIPLPPFAWMATFLANATVLCDSPSPGLRAHVARAWKMASLWPRQSIFVSGMFVVFAGVVFLNWLTACLAIPYLLKTFFGLESTFTLIGGGVFNSTLVASAIALTYLSIGPLLAATYALRCFHGESLRSGEDLKAEIKRMATASRPLAVLLLIGSALWFPQSTTAAEPPPPSAAAATVQLSPQPVDGSPLDRALDQTIHQSKYLWRMPKGLTPQDAAEEGALVRFFRRAAELLRDALRSVGDWLSDWWDKLFARSSPKVIQPGLPSGWFAPRQLLILVLVAAIGALIGLLLFRLKKRSRQKAVKAQPLSATPLPDLADETVGADQLPEDGWTKLGRELLEHGDFRLAMRAFYFAGLAHLAARNLIVLARHKSNRDYLAELRRRAHSFPGLLPVFQDNLAVFERTWYGTYEADLESTRQFAAVVEKLKSTG